jgi:hypothetical protein
LRRFLVTATLLGRRVTRRRERMRSSSKARRPRYIPFRIGLGIGLIGKQKKQPSSSRAADQKAVDKALLATIKKEPYLISYLGSSFSLRKGDRPHEMVW